VKRGPKSLEEETENTKLVSIETDHDETKEANPTSVPPRDSIEVAPQMPTATMTT
ncbi:hypothetical protein J1N35_043514, partial [Gossypium stocksii]